MFKLRIIQAAVFGLFTTYPVFISNPANTTKVTVTAISAKQALDVNIANTASVPSLDVAVVTSSAANRNIFGISGPTTDYTCPASKWCTCTVFLNNGVAATTVGSTIVLKTQGNGFKGITIPVVARENPIFEAQAVYLPASGTLQDQVTVGAGTGTIVIAWTCIER